MKKLQLPKKQVGLSWPSPVATIKLQETHPKLPQARMLGPDQATDAATEPVFAVPEPPLASEQLQMKLPMQIAPVREDLLGYQDFDINLCRSQREVQST